MRCTVAGLTPCASAMVRQLQWVIPFGVVWSVASMICFTFFAEIDGRRPRPFSTSVSAGVPPSSKRSRHRITVGRLVPSCRAMLRLERPSAANRMMRDRSTMLCGVLRARTHASRTWRCSGRIASASAESHMPAGYADPPALSSYLRDTALEQRLEALQVDVAAGEEDDDAAVGGRTQSAGDEGREAGGARGLDSELESRHDEAHRLQDLLVGHGHDVLDEQAHDVEV